MMRTNRRTSIFADLFLLAGLLAFSLAQQASAQSEPSDFCHVTDGAFTACADGSQEWSDVPFVSFPETGNFLYGDQADLWRAPKTPIHAPKVKKTK